MTNNEIKSIDEFLMDVPQDYENLLKEYIKIRKELEKTKEEYKKLEHNYNLLLEDYKMIREFAVRKGIMVVDDYAEKQPSEEKRPEEKQANGIERTKEIK